MEEELAADIESVVDDRRILENPLEEARQSKIQGEVAQPDVMDLLDNHDALFRLCSYEYKQRRSDEPAPLAPVSEHLASDGHLDDATQEEFVSLWEDIDWIVPAVSIPTKNLGGLEEHWSDISMEPQADQPELMEYTMRWGVDEQLDAKIPGQRILARAVFELNFIAGYFEYWQDTEEISDELVSYLIEEYDIGWTKDMLRNILSQLEAIDTEESTIGNSNEDPAVDVSWDNSASGDDVIGKIRVTPPGEEITRGDETDDGDTPPRGFQ
jgi:hypothetical protein